MRLPSECLRRSVTTFHSMSAGGRLVGLLKKTSYSIFKRRSSESRCVNSSSMVTGDASPANSLGTARPFGQISDAHEGSGTKVTKGASSLELLVSSQKLLSHD